MNALFRIQLLRFVGFKNDLMRILVVEDEHGISNFLKQGLEKDFALDLAKNGKIGVEMALAGVYDFLPVFGEYDLSKS